MIHTTFQPPAVSLATIFRQEFDRGRGSSNLLAYLGTPPGHIISHYYYITFDFRCEVINFDIYWRHRVLENTAFLFAYGGATIDDTRRDHFKKRS